MIAFAKWIRLFKTVEAFFCGFLFFFTFYLHSNEAIVRAFFKDSLNLTNFGRVSIILIVQTWISGFKEFEKLLKNTFFQENYTGFLQIEKLNRICPSKNSPKLQFKLKLNLV
jgi:hypothetical protein